MECGEIEILLAEYAAGRLEAAEKRKVEQHLESCEACRRELEETRTLFTLTVRAASSRPDEVPASYFEAVWPRLYGRIQAEKLNQAPQRAVKRLLNYLPVRRLGTFQLVNLSLIVIVSFSLYLSYLSDDGPGKSARPQFTVDSVGADSSRTRPANPGGARDYPAAVAASGPDADTGPLEELDQLLDPAKQRQIYDSLTDYLADVVVMLD